MVLHFSVSSIALMLSRRLTMAAMAILAAMLCFGMIEAAAPGVAEAGAAKKVKFGAKYVGKGLRVLEKAGRKAQAKRGIVGKTGGILRKGAGGMRKGVSKFSRGVSKAERGVGRQIGKSRTGRSIQKGWRKAQRFKTKSVNRAFRKCRGKACRFGKDAVNALTP